MEDEIEKTYYKTASAHFITRYQMRDNIILFYLAAIGAILGVAFGTNGHLYVLLVIPIISLGCTFLIVHHNVMLGVLLDYLSKSTNNSKIQSFENSSFLAHRYNLALNLRTWGQFLILFLPCLFSLIINVREVALSVEFLITWIFALVCTIIGGFLLYYVHKTQKNIKQSNEL